MKSTKMLVMISILVVQLGHVGFSQVGPRQLLNCSDAFGNDLVNVASLPFRSGITSTGSCVNHMKPEHSTWVNDAVNFNGPDKVYLLSPATEGTVTITCKTNAKGVCIALFNGCPLDEQQSDCVGYSAGDGMRNLQARLTQGRSYYLVVDSKESGSGFNYTLDISAPDSKGNGAIENVVIIPSLPYYSQGRSTCGKGDKVNENAVVFSENMTWLKGEDEVFQFKPAVSGNVTIVLSSSAGNAAVFLSSACPLTASEKEQVLARSAIDRQASGRVKLTAAVNAGESYYLIVDAAKDCHSYSMSITAPSADLQEDNLAGSGLISFSAVAGTDAVICEWTSVLEPDVKGYEVQRAVTPGQFATVGWIEGQTDEKELKSYRFSDVNVEPDKVYYYRLKQFEMDGGSLNSETTASSIKASGAMVLEAFPNPYIGQTRINYILSRASLITIEIADLHGNIVKRYLQGLQEPGQYTFPFSAKENGLEAGNYLVSVWCDDVHYQLRLAENE